MIKSCFQTQSEVIWVEGLPLLSPSHKQHPFKKFASMRIFIAMAMVLGWCSLAAAQNVEVRTSAEVMPYFWGCQEWDGQPEQKRKCSNEKLVRFITNYLQYPDSAKEEGIEGTVYVSFVVDANGLVGNIELLKDIGYGCGEAAMQLVKEMPRWEPATEAGTPVSVRLNLPIQFKLKNTAEEPDDYSLSWGKLIGTEISKDELLNHLYERITVRDAFGNECYISDLSFDYERKGRHSSVRSNGLVTPEVEKFLQKLKPGGQLSLTATVQKGVDFFQVSRTFMILK